MSRHGTRLEQIEYPTRAGLPINPYELAIPETTLSDREYTTNNHHDVYEHKAMSRFIITATLRDLEAYQHIMPIDSHAWLHYIYSAPTIDLESAYRRVHEAHEADERLRFGSARNPRYANIGAELITKIDQEWDSLCLK